MAFDPISVILFILFIVVPIVNNLMKGSQRQPPPHTTRRPNPGTGTPQVIGRKNPASATPEQKDLEQRLEEARRRVQEAMSDPRDAERYTSADTNLPERGIPGSARQASQSVPQQTLRPQRPQRPQPPLRPQTLEQPARHAPRRESLGDVFSETSPERPQSLETLMPLTGTSFKEAPPMRVSRAGGVKGATIGGGGVRFDGDSIMQGIIWHEILQEAPSRRRRRVSRR